MSELLLRRLNYLYFPCDLEKKLCNATVELCETHKSPESAAFCKYVVLWRRN